MEEFAKVADSTTPSVKEKVENDVFVVEDEAWKKGLIFAQLDQIAATAVCVRNLMNSSLRLIAKQLIFLVGFRKLQKQ